MKFKRTDKDFGGGSGREIFNSGLFRVVWWVHGGEAHISRTVLEIKITNKEIQLEGKVSLRTDKHCFEQLEYAEVKEIIFKYGEEQFERGKKEQQREMRKVFGITNSFGDW